MFAKLLYALLASVLFIALATASLKARHKPQAPTVEISRLNGNIIVKAIGPRKHYSVVFPQ